MKNLRREPIFKHRNDLGYYITLFGSSLLLLWIGIFKFTPTEANAIEPLVVNHPLTFWFYDLLSVQAVSNIIGIMEISVAILLVLSLKYKVLKKYAGISLLIIFGMTLSYLFTTPGVWKTVDGVFLTDFFILKDLAYLGLGFTLLSESKK